MSTPLYTDLSTDRGAYSVADSCSSHLSPMHRLYHLYILHYHFALCTFQTHTHTQAQEHYLALSIHTSTRTLYFFALSTPAAQDHFPPDTDTVTIIAHY